MAQPIHSGADSESEEVIVFVKYIHHAKKDDADDADADMPLLEVEGGSALTTAFICRRQLSPWNRLMYFLRVAKPVEGPQWIQVPVKPMTKRYEIDDGDYRMRPVNVMDCHAQTALFVSPFIRLYQVRIDRLGSAHVHVRELVFAAVVT